MAGAALATDVPAGRLEYSKRVSEGDLRKAFPQKAWEEKISGDVRLDCLAAPNGALVDCKVVEETPGGYGFGEAALSIVGKERLKPKDTAGNLVAGHRLSREMSFLAPGDSNQDWLEKPTIAQFAAVMPTEAMKKGENGSARIQCRVTAEGFLSACKVLSEQPDGLGFGAAALQLSAQFRLKPAIRGRKVVPDQTVTLPMKWEGLADFRGVNIDRGDQVILDPPWLSAPTAAEMQAAWPPKSKGEKAGLATLTCRMTAEGGLKSCSVISETPDGRGFGQAAKGLVDKFRLRLTPDETKSISSYWVDVPFRFRDPAEPDARKIGRPKWIRALTVEHAVKIFPAKAKAAGVFTGVGTINCLVGTSGALSDCKVVKEAPEGLGFGEAALQAAVHMTMNPWSAEGDPLEGLRANIPVRLVIDPPSPPPAP